MSWDQEREPKDPGGNNMSKYSRKKKKKKKTHTDYPGQHKVEKNHSSLQTGQLSNPDLCWVCAGSQF